VVIKDLRKDRNTALAPYIIDEQKASWADNQKSEANEEANEDVGALPLGCPPGGLMGLCLIAIGVSGAN
jgi:hypothetical protein